MKHIPNTHPMPQANNPHKLHTQPMAHASYWVLFPFDSDPPAPHVGPKESGLDNFRYLV